MPHEFPFDPSFFDITNHNRDPEPSPDIEPFLEAIDALPPEEREVIEGIYWEVCSRRSLARRLGIGRAEVERRHQRGLKRMREHFGA